MHEALGQIAIAVTDIRDRGHIIRLCTKLTRSQIKKLNTAIDLRRDYGDRMRPKLTLLTSHLQNVIGGGFVLQQSHTLHGKEQIALRQHKQQHAESGKLQPQGAEQQPDENAGSQRHTT